MSYLTAKLECSEPGGYRFSSQAEKYGYVLHHGQLFQL